MRQRFQTLAQPPPEKLGDPHGQAALESLVAYPVGKRARSRALKLAGSVRSTAIASLSPGAWPRLKAFFTPTIDEDRELVRFASWWNASNSVKCGVFGSDRAPQL
jgi:hypothetical protein